MLIIPAIDIKEGKVVRLIKGRFEEEIIYSKNPSRVARMWQELGAKIIHVVDLDGAKEGELKNKRYILEILQNIDIPIQVGGGIRDLDTLKELFSIGVSKVVLGTVAVENNSLLKKGLEKFKSRVIIAVDVLNNYVAIRGWQKKSSLRVVDFILKIKEIGVEEIIYTDISRDGTLRGPNLEGLREIAESSNLKVIASGGISKIEDIKSIKKIEHLGIKGVIIGKALYSKKIDLREAIKIGEASQ